MLDTLRRALVGASSRHPAMGIAPSVSRRGILLNPAEIFVEYVLEEVLSSGLFTDQLIVCSRRLGVQSGECPVLCLALVVAS